MLCFEDEGRVSEPRNILLIQCIQTTSCEVWVQELYLVRIEVELYYFEVLVEKYFKVLSGKKI